MPEVQDVDIDQLNVEEMNDEQLTQNGKDAPSDNDLEALRPHGSERSWIIGQGDYQRTYLQKPLSFFGKMEFLKLVGGVIDGALESGTSIDSLLGSVPQRGPNLSPDDLRQADSFVMIAAKLTEHAPDFLLDSFCIWLRVPEGDRYWVKQVLKDELDDATAMGIIETFVDQNVEEIEDFFTKQLPSVAKRISARRKDHKASSKQ